MGSSPAVAKIATIGSEVAVGPIADESLHVGSLEGRPTVEEVEVMTCRSGSIAAILLLLAIFLVACGDDSPSAPGGNTSGLDQLPPDTGGTHTAFVRDLDAADGPIYGTWVYVPGGADRSPVPYPLLIFLHGAGERGDSAADPSRLDIVLRNGPPRMIDRETWAPPHPMIVVSPQCHDGWWQPSSIRALLEWADANYPIDRSRIYVTGLSMGGFGTWAYLAAHGATDDDPLPIAAAVPICGGGSAGSVASMVSTPVWAFHGTADGVVNVNASIAMVKALGAADPVVAPRLTLYDGVGHDSWSRTYQGTGNGEGLTTYDGDPDVNPWLVPLDRDVFDWMLGHQR